MVYILKITSIRRPAKVCTYTKHERLQIRHFSSIDSLKNATDTVLILCRDSKRPMLLSKYNTEKTIIKSVIGCRVSNTN